MPRKKLPPPHLPARQTVRANSTRELIGLLERAQKEGVRPLPRIQLENYFADIDAFCGSKDAAEQYGSAILVEILTAATALKAALSSKDPDLIAVRALELGEYRFQPGAFYHRIRSNKSLRAGRQTGDRRAKNADNEAVAAFREWAKTRETKDRPLSALMKSYYLSSKMRFSKKKKARIRRLLEEGKISAT